MQRVMLVEDEMLVRLGMKNSIDWAKFDMSLIADVSNGHAALDIYEKEKPDLIITDLKMPGMDGMKLIEIIRQKDRETGIIILTCLEEYTGNITFLADPGPDALFKSMYAKEYDLVICSIGSRLSYGLNVVRLHDEIARNMMGGWTKMGTPIIFVSHFHPFVHKEYEASIDTMINTYGVTDYTAKCIIEGITGKRELKRDVFVHDI